MLCTVWRLWSSKYKDTVHTQKSIAQNIDFPHLLLSRSILKWQFIFIYTLTQQKQERTRNKALKSSTEAPLDAVIVTWGWGSISHKTYTKPTRYRATCSWHENMASLNVMTTNFHKVKRTTEFCLSRQLRCSVFFKNEMENTGENRTREMTPGIQKGSQLITSFLADFTNIRRLLLKG